MKGYRLKELADVLSLFQGVGLEKYRAVAFYLPCNYCKVLKYHPLINEQPPRLKGVKHADSPIFPFKGVILIVILSNGG